MRSRTSRGSATACPTSPPTSTPSPSPAWSLTRQTRRIHEALYQGRPAVPRFPGSELTLIKNAEIVCLHYVTRRRVMLGLSMRLSLIVGGRLALLVGLTTAAVAGGFPISSHARAACGSDDCGYARAA